MASDTGVIQTRRGTKTLGVINGKYRFQKMWPGGDRWGVHRLVALAYLGEPPEGFVVRHLDGNSNNNNIRNLAYGTCAQNSGDIRQHGRTARGERQGLARLTADDVRAIRATPHITLVEWGKRLGVNHKTICEVRLGRTWRHVE